MEDLNSVISSILSDPQKMEQLRGVAQSLGMAPNGGAPGAAAAPPTPPPNQPDMMSMLGNLMSGMNMGGSAPGTDSQGDAASSGGAPSSGGFNLGSLSSLAGLFGGGGGGGGGSDKNVQLLRALQPHISSQRAGRVDDAVRIMQLISAWPALRDSGLLGNLGNLFSGGGHR